MQYIHTYTPEQKAISGVNYERLVFQPTIFMRHSALPKDGMGIYSCEGDAFSLNATRIGRLVSILNECDLSRDTGVVNIESKRQHQLQLLQYQPISTEIAERLSAEYGVNMLGGVYCAFLEQYGIHTIPIGDLCLGEADVDILTAFYPDLENYFRVAISDLTQEYRRHAYSVIQNNIGRMRVFSSWDATEEDTEGLLRKITFLKRAFRYLTHLTIKTNRVDNLVHSPENLEEFELYKRLITLCS